MRYTKIKYFDLFSIKVLHSTQLEKLILHVDGRQNLMFSTKDTKVIVIF